MSRSRATPDKTAYDAAFTFVLIVEDAVTGGLAHPHVMPKLIMRHTDDGRLLTDTGEVIIAALAGKLEIEEWVHMTDEQTVFVRLTKDEAEVIDRIREKRARELFAKKIGFKYLEIAHRYAVWLDKSGREDSYQTFVNDFDYKPEPGEDQGDTWREVRQLISNAKSAAMGRILT